MIEYTVEIWDGDKWEVTATTEKKYIALVIFEHYLDRKEDTRITSREFDGADR
jgi:hypothetical protein